MHKELSIIQNNGKHLLNLLNDVLDLSKIAAAKFELRPQQTDLQQLIIEVHSLLSVSAIDKGLAFVFGSETALPKTILIDDVRCKQVLVNIIGNAIKFTDRGTVSVSLSLNRQSAEQPLDYIQVKICDTGIGMDSKQIEDIFTPFHQVEDVTNRKAGGAGLGLSITAEIVKQMRGHLHVESSLNQGTCFTLTLPAIYDQQEFIDYHFDYTKQIISSDACPCFKGRVLVVDDVFEIRQLVGYFATQTGLQVEYAKHGEQALERVTQASHPFDIILIDLHMPVMNGRDTVATLRSLDDANTANTALVAMTAATQQGLEQELLDSGFDGLISKPIDKPRLWDLFYEHLPVTSSVATSKHVNGIVKAPAASESVLNDKLIHLVEDDKDSADIMQLLLKSLGFAVLYSSSGKEALHTIANNTNISVHLLDLGLPDISGQELLSAVFSLDVSGKLIVLSGREPDPDLLSRFPIAKHIIKPVSKQDLVTILEI